MVIHVLAESTSKKCKLASLRAANSIFPHAAERKIHRLSLALCRGVKGQSGSDRGTCKVRRKNAVERRSSWGHFKQSTSSQSVLVADSKQRAPLNGPNVLRPNEINPNGDSRQTALWEGDWERLQRAEGCGGGKPHTVLSSDLKCSSHHF